MPITTFDLPISLVEAITALLLKGHVVDDTDCKILRQCIQIPQPLNDISAQLPITYDATRKRTEKLIRVGLLTKINTASKTKLYLTQVSEEDNQSLPVPANYKIHFQRQEYTVWEFIAVLSEDEYMTKLSKSLVSSVLHLRYNLDQEETVAPTGNDTRTLHRNITERLRELYLIVDQLTRMPIYDNSVGAAQALKDIPRPVVKVAGPAWNKALEEGKINSHGMKHSYEKTKFIQTITNNCKSILGETDEN